MQWNNGRLLRSTVQPNTQRTVQPFSRPRRFKHPVDWIAYYAQKCVETAYEVSHPTHFSQFCKAQRTFADFRKGFCKVLSSSPPLLFEKEGALGGPSGGGHRDPAAVEMLATAGEGRRPWTVG